MSEAPDQPERPDDDADAAEIAAWMEADFTAAVTEGLSEGTDTEEDSDSHE